MKELGIPSDNILLYVMMLAVETQVTIKKYHSKVTTEKILEGVEAR